MEGYLEKVGDQFGVSRRLKEIDPTYEVYYNKKMKRYEVYGGKTSKKVLQIVSPFETLDARLVAYARKTRVENLNKIITEMDKQNELLLEKQEKEVMEDKKAQILEGLKKSKFKN